MTASDGMSADQAKMVSTGDMLEPITLWNRTSGSQQLTSPTKVLDVRRQSGCQTGVMLKVRFLNGTERFLDAGWFKAQSK